MNPARLILFSGNGKIGPGEVAATYVSIPASCPHDCPFKDALPDEHAAKGPCYANQGRVAANIGYKINAVKATAIQAARAEAREIRYWAPLAPEGHPLRLHVMGDCRTATAARIVSRACNAWRGPVWVYSHAWRTVPRSAWGRVSVLASIEDPREGRAVIRRGYAPALVVDGHPKDGKAWKAHGVTWIPCPEQTRGRTCVQCRLCFDADKLRKRKQGITFDAHGQSRARVVRRLQVIQGGT